MKNNGNMIIVVIILAILISVSVLVFLFVDNGTKTQPKQEADRTYNDSVMWPYIIEAEMAKQIAPDTIAQYKVCPRLRPDRFRRRIKMLYGIDLADYPAKSSLFIYTWGAPFSINLESQIFSFYDRYAGIELETEPNLNDSIYKDWESEQGPSEFFIPPYASMYYELRKLAMINDTSVINILVNDRLDLIKEQAKDPEKKEALEVFGYEEEISIDFINNLYISSLFYVNPKIVDYVQKTIVAGSHYKLLEYDFIQTEMRLDILYVLALSDKNILRSLIYYYSPGIQIAKLLETEVNRWGDRFDRSRSIAAAMDYSLRYSNVDASNDRDLKEAKTKSKKDIIEFMSGEKDYYRFRPAALCEEVRQNIRANNYYGYALLREFCENQMREMPTLEEIGTSFVGCVKTDNSLLLLEPTTLSLDIDTIQPNESFTAYEMGHDDYYFIEIEKPVESPVADKDGYAMILDRTETVYGYLRKKEVVKYASNEANTIKTDVGKQGIINDPDGYVNIRQAPNVKSAIVGKLLINEVFNYSHENDTWSKVTTTDGKQGYVYKNRIKEKPNTGGWSIDK